MLPLLGVFAWVVALYAARVSAADGGVPKVRDKTEARLIEVTSYLDEDADLCWLRVGDPVAKAVLIVQLPAHTATQVTSFPGHHFVVTRVGNPVDSELLHEFYVIHTVDTYAVGKPRKRSSEDIIVPLHNPTRITQMGAKFKSLYPFKLTRWYDDGGEGTYQGTLGMGQENTVSTFEGHEFYFTLFDNKSVEVARFTMDPETYMYVLYPHTEEQRAMVPAELIVDNDRHLAFMQEYKERTGRQWRHHFANGLPRPPPVLHMWPAESLGQTHFVTSSEGHWFCRGPSATCQSAGNLSLTLTALSLAPRVFHVPGFLSDFECDSIIDLAAPQIKQSIVGSQATGAFASSTRTSHNAWIKRQASDVTQTLYRRAAHLLQLEEAQLDTNTNTEEMQVVHYENGQRYDAHHDWGSHGVPQSRLITLLLYLTDMHDEHAGGETAFPKGNNGAGFKVPPVKGNAVLFYNLLEDGNGDDLSLHAALPVHEGQKWLANFWVWDPHR